VTKGITNGGIVSKKIVVSYVIVPLKWSEAIVENNKGNDHNKKKYEQEEQ
jgi:hypothetical protein